MGWVATEFFFQLQVGLQLKKVHHICFVIRTSDELQYKLQP
jgi:hypothetical protein